MAIGRDYTENKSNKELIGQIGFGSPVIVNKTLKRRVLITGSGSYIGESFKAYATKNYATNFEIDTLDMLNPDWKSADFSSYDIVYHVAGIAHADVGKVSDEVKEKYYRVNTDLTVDVCKKAKKSGVKTFIFMSSMIVYGDSAGFGKQRVINGNTVPSPASFYGDSKLQADIAVRDLADDSFQVYVLRPPMIYGKGSKGNYPLLAKFAKKLPIFPNVDNERSMLHIDNLCEFLCQIMLIQSVDNSVVLIPQNSEYTNTCLMVKKIADVTSKRIRLWKFFNPFVFIASMIPGKISGLVNKAFGNMTYDTSISNYVGVNYQLFSLDETIERTEG